MLTVAEIVTAVGAVTTVVGASIAATVYFADGKGADQAATDLANAGLHRYVISDAYYLCRDHIDSAVPYQVRNINVDSHSSRYDESRNDNVVFIDLQLLEGKDGRADEAKDAQVECRVSAADNEIRSFQVRKG